MVLFQKTSVLLDILGPKVLNVVHTNVDRQGAPTLMRAITILTQFAMMALATITDVQIQPHATGTQRLIVMTNLATITVARTRTPAIGIRTPVAMMTPVITMAVWTTTRVTTIALRDVTMTHVTTEPAWIQKPATTTTRECAKTILNVITMHATIPRRVTMSQTRIVDR